MKKRKRELTEEERRAAILHAAQRIERRKLNAKRLPSGRMIPQEIAKRIIVPDTGLLDLGAEFEAIWFRAVRGALALAMQPLERYSGVERLAALPVLWNEGADKTGLYYRYASEWGRLPQTQKLYNTLRRLTPAARVLIAYANLLCHEKQVPTVKAIQDEIIRDGKARGERYTLPGHSGVRFILSRAELPMTKPGWRRKKR